MRGGSRGKNPIAGRGTEEDRYRRYRKAGRAPGYRGRCGITGERPAAGNRDRQKVPGSTGSHTSYRPSGRDAGLWRRPFPEKGAERATPRPRSPPYRHRSTIRRVLPCTHLFHWYRKRGRKTRVNPMMRYVRGAVQVASGKHSGTGTGGPQYKPVTLIPAPAKV